MERIESLIKDLTLEEKVSMLSGSTAWHTTAVPRLGIPRIKMTDGPIGARGDSVSGETSACFPSASCLSSSWDVDNIEEIAKAIGIEAKSIHDYMGSMMSGHLEQQLNNLDDNYNNAILLVWGTLDQYLAHLIVQ